MSGLPWVTKRPECPRLLAGETFDEVYGEVAAQFVEDFSSTLAAQLQKQVGSGVLAKFFENVGGIGRVRLGKSCPFLKVAVEVTFHLAGVRSGAGAYEVAISRWSSETKLDHGFLLRLPRTA